MAPYVFTAVWHAGKLLCILDALSCFPTSRPTPEDEEDCTTSTAHVRCIVAATATFTTNQEDGPALDADRTLQELRTIATQDQDYHRLLH